MLYSSVQKWRTTCRDYLWCCILCYTVASTISGHENKKRIIPIRLSKCENNTALGRYFCNLDYFKAEKNEILKDWFWKTVVADFNVEAEDPDGVPEGVLPRDLSYEKTINTTIRAKLKPSVVASSSPLQRDITAILQPAMAPGSSNTTSSKMEACPSHKIVNPNAVSKESFV